MLTVSAQIFTAFSCNQLQYLGVCASELKHALLCLLWHWHEHLQMFTTFQVQSYLRLQRVILSSACPDGASQQESDF